MGAGGMAKTKVNARIKASPGPSMVAALRRGSLWLAAARGLVFVAAYGVAWVLAMRLSPADFGLFALLHKGLAAATTVLHQGWILFLVPPLAATLASSVGDGEKGGEPAPGRGRLEAQSTVWALSLGVLAGVALAGAAPWLAGWIGSSPLQPALLCASVSLVFLSLYGKNAAIINAHEYWGYQALLDAVFAILKALLMIAAVGLGYGLAGAFAGFSLAAAGVWGGSWILLFWMRGRRPYAPKGGAFVTSGGLFGPELRREAAVSALLLVTCSQFLWGLDILALQLGTSHKEIVGGYAALQMLAMVPASLLQALNFAALPLVAKQAPGATEVDPAASRPPVRRERSQELVRPARPARFEEPARSEPSKLGAQLGAELGAQIVIWHALVLGGYFCLLAPRGPVLVDAIFSPRYSLSSDILYLLILGYGGLSLGWSALWCLCARGQSSRAARIALFWLGIALCGIFGIVALEAGGPSGEELPAVLAGALSWLGAGVAVHGLWLWWGVGVRIGVTWLLRWVLLCSLLFFVSRSVWIGPWWHLLLGAILYAAGVLGMRLLFVGGEEYQR